MRILYDHQAFTGTIYGGVPRYFTDLMGNLSTNGHAVNLATRFSNNLYLQNKQYFRGKTYTYFLGHRWTCTVLSHLNRLGAVANLLKNEFDVFHPTFYNPYFLDFIGKRPYVITYHDAIKDKFGEKYGHLDNISVEQKQRLLSQAAKVIAVSESTKNDLIEIFDINPDKVVVIHHATNFQGITPKPVANVPERYLLYVGGRNDYKQFLPFVEATAELLKKENVSLLCTGSGEFTAEENKAINKLGASHLVSHRKVNDGELKTLYQDALAFVYPSKYEGFGIPILEAFASNCPTVLSNSSCFPEVAKDAALYFNPESNDSMATAVQQIITNPAVREELIQKGRKRFADFSIEKMAQQTLTVYESIAS
jgi:glycosyltransferase involved in cell wall biosynthesis